MTRGAGWWLRCFWPALLSCSAGFLAVGLALVSGLAGRRGLVVMFALLGVALLFAGIVYTVHRHRYYYTRGADR